MHKGKEHRYSNSINIRLESQFQFGYDTHILKHRTYALHARRYVRRCRLLNLYPVEKNTFLGTESVGIDTPVYTTQQRTTHIAK